jgi:hypothetical protein
MGTLVLLAATLATFNCSNFTQDDLYGVRSTKELHFILANCFTYQKEKREYWKSPIETIKDRGGDCEDFAVLVQDILQKKGTEAKILGIFYEKQKSGHAIVVWKNNKGYLEFFSNNVYYASEFNNIFQIVDAYYPKGWQYFRVCNRFKHYGICGKRIHNPKSN